MQQIADWLEKLGMSEYAQRFAENRIGFSILRELSDQDLKELGVVLGDRRKILRAIADIEGNEKNGPTAAQRRKPVASESIPTATPSPISLCSRLRTAERPPAMTNATAAPVQQLDLATVIKVSQAVSSEIVFDKLIDTLMRMAIEQAAQSAAFCFLRKRTA